MIEQNLPILSEKEIQMKSFLDKSEIQLTFFKENLLRLEKYLSIDDKTNGNNEDKSNVSLQYLQDHLDMFQNRIQQLKTQFEHFHRNK